MRGLGSCPRAWGLVSECAQGHVSVRGAGPACRVPGVPEVFPRGEEDRTQTPLGLLGGKASRGFPRRAGAGGRRAAPVPFLAPGLSVDTGAQLTRTAAPLLGREDGGEHAAVQAPLAGARSQGVWSPGSPAGRGGAWPSREAWPPSPGPAPRRDTFASRPWGGGDFPAAVQKVSQAPEFSMGAGGGGVRGTRSEEAGRRKRRN